MHYSQAIFTFCYLFCKLVKIGHGTRLGIGLMAVICSFHESHF